MTIIRATSTAAASQYGNHNGSENQTSKDNASNGCPSEARIRTNALTGRIRVTALSRITLRIVRARVTVFSTTTVKAFLFAVATVTAFSGITLRIVRARVTVFSTTTVEAFLFAVATVTAFSGITL